MDVKVSEDKYIIKWLDKNLPMLVDIALQILRNKEDVDRQRKKK